MKKKTMDSPNKNVCKLNVLPILDQVLGNFTEVHTDKRPRVTPISIKNAKLRNRKPE